MVIISKYESHPSNTFGNMDTRRKMLYFHTLSLTATLRLSQCYKKLIHMWFCSWSPYIWILKVIGEILFEISWTKSAKPYFHCFDLENWATGSKSWYIWDSVHSYHIAKIWKPLVKYFRKYRRHKMQNAIFSHIKFCSDLENWATVTKSWYIWDALHGIIYPNLKAIGEILLEILWTQGAKWNIFTHYQSCCDLENWAKSTKSWCIRDSVHGHYMSKFDLSSAFVLSRALDYIQAFALYKTHVLSL